MKTYDIYTKQTVTQEEIDDVLTTAFESGVAYWCSEIRIKKGFEPKEDYKYMSDVLTRGGVLELFDVEESNPETNHKTYGVWHTLTFDRLLKALGDTMFDFDNYDSESADQVVQKAIFGEVVYG